MTPQRITIDVTVPVPPQRAWQLYTDARELMQWNFASDDWHCPSAAIDLRPGGRHMARMEAKDGSFGFDFEGTYGAVEAPHLLTIVLADGRTSRTTFQPVRDGTLVTTTFDAEAGNSAEVQRAGWQAILDNFGRHAGQSRTG